MRLPCTALLALLLAPSVHAGTPANVEQALKGVISGPQRTPAFVERDRYRHPLQTLEFFGIRPDMTVVEVLPGGGWYTEILAPFLHDDGKLIEASVPLHSENPFFRRMAVRYQEKLDSTPQIYGRITLTPFAPPDYVALGPPASADMILTFRNMHDFVYANVHHEVTDAVMQRFLRAAYLALKPGGVLGVVGHRANADEPVAKAFEKGRLPQAWVVHEARKAGFELAASAEINANPKDNRKLPVWYLPPSLSQGREAKYLDVGEADNMTLRFVKPAGE